MPEQLYERVAAELEQRIRAGVYPPGKALPSRSALRAEFDVSQSVVDKAMMILRAKALVETLPGVAVLVVDPLPPVSPR
jgi:GntR family transcriptional regulator